ncbi:hypothetical protein [Sphingomonas alpina]|uniref:Peptidase n=1 Tax=Sphingomonas alpina TaxID=653931 RepID=A0A7H0LF66_9SPHN|nr:hypothetical protein [Sphingomonas alpina]QNQ08319.1 hypothetical protein H3Z74_16385 [Sphingomonas alpina]
MQTSDQSAGDQSWGKPATIDGFDNDHPTALGAEQDLASGSRDGLDGADAASGIPHSYQLTAPEGITLDPVAIEAATPVFRELGLSNEAANKLMPVAADFARGITDRLNQQIVSEVQASRKAWLDSARADPEIGGPHWSRTIATAASALDALGFTRGSPFRMLLDESGLGNHPEMIRAFHKVGKAIGEDSNFTRGQSASSTRKGPAETLYPDDTPKGGH